MARPAIKALFLALCSYTLALSLEIDQQEALVISPINGKQLQEVMGGYSFLVGGHLYGAPEIQALFPSSSLLGSLDDIKQTEASFFIALGDIFRSEEDLQIANFQKSFSDQLDIPMFNSVGNHDVINRQKYMATFGETYYDFQLGTELFVILDSELDNSNIAHEQYDYLISVLDLADSTPGIKNIFIFSHKLLWAANLPKYQIIYDHLNSKQGYHSDMNISKKIFPRLKSMSNQKNIFWMSGDIGCSWSLPLFYDKDPDTGLTFIATGIGDTNSDALVSVAIENGYPSFAVFPLGGGKSTNALESYNLDYWTNYFKQNSSGYTFSILFNIARNKYYLAGVLTAAVLAMLICGLNGRFGRQQGSI